MIRSTLVIASLVAGCSKPAIERGYWDIVALDDGSALVTWQDRGRSFGVSRLDPSAQYRWSADLEGRPNALDTDHGIIVADDLVALRTYHRSEHRQMVEGVSLETGRRSWVTGLRSVRSSAEGVSSFSGFATKALVRLFFKPGQDTSQSELIDVDVRTGQERGRTALPIQDAEAPLMVDGEAILHSRPSANGVIVRVGTDVTTLASSDYGCVIGEEYWRLVRTSERWELTALRDKTRKSIPIEPIAADRELSFRGCAAYRDKLVLFVGVGFLNDEMRILDFEGNQLRRVSLGDLDDPYSLRRKSPHSTFATGTLPRFVPVSLDRQAPVLAMVDLERGEIVWRSPSSVHATLFRSGNRWYWTLADDDADRGTRLVVFDGDTGEAKAVHVRAPHLLHEIGPSNVAGDSFWLLAGSDTASTSAPPVARLDAKTLQVRAAIREFDIVEMPFEIDSRASNR